MLSIEEIRKKVDEGYILFYFDDLFTLWKNREARQLYVRTCVFKGCGRCCYLYRTFEDWLAAAGNVEAQSPRLIKWHEWETAHAAY